MRIFLAAVLLWCGTALRAETYYGTFSQARYQTATIGTFRFLPGRAGYVRISTERTTRGVNVDAITMERVSDGQTDTLDSEDGVDFYLHGTWNPGSRDPHFGEGFYQDGSTEKGEKYAVFIPNIAVEDDYILKVHSCYHSSLYDVNVPITVRYNITDTAYGLTVSGGSGGGSYGYMRTPVITADNPPDGYVFDTWITSGGGHFAMASSPVTAFTMPDTAVTVTATYKAAAWIRESARDIPLIAEVDLVVVNPNLGGIAAALAAADSGASVMIFNGTTSFPYEMSAKKRFWLGPGEAPRAGLGQDLFGTRADVSGYTFYQPSTIKKTIEELLDAAGIDFLYSTHAVGTMEDGSGNLAGVLVANKSGRQAVGAKVVIDCTPMAGFARLAGAGMSPWPSGPVTVTRTMMWDGSDSDGIYIVANPAGDVREYASTVTMQTGSWEDRCRAEAVLRSDWPKKNAAWAAHHMHMIEPNHIIAKATDTVSAWSGAGNVDPGVCRPQGRDRVFVLSSACAVSRAAADSLVRPLTLVAVAEGLMADIMNIVDSVSAPAIYEIPVSTDETPVTSADVSEDLSGHRPFVDFDFVSQGARDVPVWGTEYDVIVVGGGTAGAPAAIAAARAGARVLVIEMLGALGGTGTAGIGHYFWNDDLYLYGLPATYGTDEVWSGKSSWMSVHKQQWLFDEIHRAGGEIWFNTLGCGTVKEGNTVTGVVVATPMGRAAVLGKVVIDGTGDGDIGAWAGGEVQFFNDGDMLLMPSCMSGNGADHSRHTQNEYTNVFPDPSSAFSMTRWFAFSRQYGTHANAWDYYPHPNVREARHIRGDVTIRSIDQLVGRTFSDLVCVGFGRQEDAGGFRRSANAYAGLQNEYACVENFIPRGALVARGLDGLMVIGRAASFTHEAIGLVRNQVDTQNEGYGAGYLAAQAALQDVAVRNVDMAAVHDHLVAVRCITAGHRDNYCMDMPGPSDSLLAAAAASPESSSMAWLLYAGDGSIPFLQAAYDSARSFGKAMALSLLGDTSGVGFLADWVDSQSLGTGDPFNTYAVREIDGAVWALGQTGDARIIPVLSAKMDECGTGDDDFSHIRALTTALGATRSPAARPALYDFIMTPGVTGHDHTEYDNVADIGPDMPNALIELHAATALYRCGDSSGVAENVLNNYLQDWRTALARYAAYILEVDTSTQVPVVLSAFNADTVAVGVRLTWATQSEERNLGFNIYRRMEGESGFIRINTSLIPGAGTTSLPQQYAYTDSVVLDGHGTVRYYLEQVDSGGSGSSSYIVSMEYGTSGIGNGFTTGPVLTILQNPWTVSGGTVNADMRTLAFFTLRGQAVRPERITESGPYLVEMNGVLRKVIILAR